MYQLLRPNHVPHQGWRWRCENPRCPVEIKGRTEDEMVELAALHCKANNIPVGMDFHELVVHMMCAQLAAEGFIYCKDKAIKQPPKRVDGRVTLSQAIVGTRTLLDWKLREGGAMVDSQEANRRASVCLNMEYSKPCPKHVSGVGCDGCHSGPLHSLVEKIVGGVLDHSNDNLKMCGVCGCALKAKVWLPLQSIHRNMPDAWNAELPDLCWAKKR